MLWQLLRCVGRFLGQREQCRWCATFLATISEILLSKIDTKRCEMSLTKRVLGRERFSALKSKLFLWRDVSDGINRLWEDWKLLEQVSDDIVSYFYTTEKQYYFHMI